MHADEARKRAEAAEAGGWSACNTTRQTNQLLFFFTSTLFTIIACLIVSFGATQMQNNLLYEMYPGARENLSAAIVVGALLIVVGCIGCFGAFFKRRTAVLCFFIFCLAVLIGQLFVITFFYARMHEDSVRLEQATFKEKWIEFARDARVKGSDDEAVEARRKDASLFLTGIQTEYACCAYDETDGPAGCDDEKLEEQLQRDAGVSVGGGEPCLQLFAPCTDNAGSPCKAKFAEFVRDALEPWAVGYIIFLAFEFVLLFSMCLVLCKIKPEARDSAEYIGDYYQTKNPA